MNMLPDEKLTDEEYTQILSELFDITNKANYQPGKPLQDPYESAFGERVAEKFRKQGLNIE